MSHFKLIQLLKEPADEDNRLRDYEINDDSRLREESDGWDEEPLEEAIDSVECYLKEIGTVDKKKKTFTFFDKQTVKDKYIASMKSVFANWKKKINGGKIDLAEYQLRIGVKEACYIDDLFYYDGYIHYASALIADYLAGYIPETMHIGTVFNCHR